MTLRILPLIADGPLRGSTVFLSSSIPNPQHWSGYFDAREITDAVVAAARAVLTAGGLLVTGAHPTISPLLLYVAAEFPNDPERPRVVVYQSGLFEPIMPEATRRFQNDGISILRITPPVPGERPVRGEWDGSLRLMREQMFSETEPAAGIYIGGMADISKEFEMLDERRPRPLAYALAAPGGEAAKLVHNSPAPVRELLASSNIYPSIFRRVVDDLAGRRPI
jgi:hypothetical protein